MARKSVIEREAEKARLLATSKSSGLAGDIFELECAPEHSRKTKVSKQGQADIYVKYGKGTVPAECKTNGGRIGSLLDGKNKARFVVYRLDWISVHKGGKHTPEWTEHRVVEPVIIPTELFLAKLIEFGATKSTNGRNPETAIQVSSKKWYEWLSEYPVEYHPDWRYDKTDFEGLN